MIQWACSQDGIEPGFKEDVIQLLTESEYQWVVMYGYRDLILQEVLYKKHLAGGPLAAPPGHSAHNFGLAVDVQLRIDGVTEWNVKLPGWQWLFAAVRTAPRLHSGIAFGDFDHIERYNWRQYENWNKEPQAAV